MSRFLILIIASLGCNTKKIVDTYTSAEGVFKEAIVEEENDIQLSVEFTVHTDPRKDTSTSLAFSSNMVVLQSINNKAIEKKKVSLKIEKNAEGKVTAALNMSKVEGDEYAVGQFKANVNKLIERTIKQRLTPERYKTAYNNVKDTNEWKELIKNIAACGELYDNNTIEDAKEKVIQAITVYNVNHQGGELKNDAASINKYANALMGLNSSKTIVDLIGNAKDAQYSISDMNPQSCQTWQTAIRKAVNNTKNLQDPSTIIIIWEASQPPVQVSQPSAPTWSQPKPLLAIKDRSSK